MNTKFIPFNELDMKTILTAVLIVLTTSADAAGFDQEKFTIESDFDGETITGQKIDFNSYRIEIDGRYYCTAELRTPVGHPQSDAVFICEEF